MKLVTCNLQPETCNLKPETEMKALHVLSFLILCSIAYSQSPDESTIRQIYNKALAEGKSYEMLDYLCTKIGARLSGSPGAAAGVEWSRHTMEDFGFDSVWLQPVICPMTLNEGASSSVWQ